LFIILLAGPFFYTPVAGHNGSYPIIAQFADSYTMPLPAVPLPSPAQLAPVSGVLRVLVIAATFSDVNNTKSTDEIKQEYFGTVANYYKEISYGAVSLQGDVVGWYHLNYSMVYYGRDCTRIDDSDCSGSPTSWWIARDAAAIAGRDVNFSNYDYYVFVHSGVGEESTGSKNKDNVWSVSYLGGVWLRTKDKSIDKFDIVPELEAGGAVPIGVYTHEFGHLLGLPDLYNTSTGLTIMGPWSLMDKGLWNGDPPGSSPAHMEAWSKIKLGWLDGSLLAVANDGTIANYTIDATEVASEAVHVVEIPVSSGSPPTQYYLVEVREQVGFDKGLPASGVLITYVDEKVFIKKVSVIDAHPGVPGLANATWQVGQVFTDQKNNIGIAINAQVGNSFQLTVNRLGPIADLSVTKVFAQPAEVSPNTTVTVFIDIANLGTVGASNIPVQIFLDGQPFANQQVTLGPAQTTEISLTWVAVAGSHVFRVVIDPSNALTELSKANNVANFTLDVGPTLIITVPLDNSTGNATAWVRVNGVEYSVNASGRVTTTVPPGPITVEVESSVYSSNSSREVFEGWSDGNSQNPRQLNVTSDTSLNALFKPQYLLTVNRNSGTTTQGGWFDANTTLTVAATSPSNVTEQAARMLFTNWSGDIESNSTTLSVGMTKPMTLNANWKLQYYLDIVSPVGSPLGSGWYDAGTPATISVQSPIDLQNDTRQMFTGWNGGTTAQDTTQTIVVSAPTVVEASWKTQYLIQVLTPYGDQQGSGWHDAGTQLQISVQPEVDHGNRTRRMFSGWTGDYSGSDASFTLTVNGPKSLMAQWTTQYELTFKVTGIPNSTSVKLAIDNSYHDISVNNGYQDWFNEGKQIEPNTNQTLIQGFTQFQFQGWRNSTDTRVSPPFTVTGPMDYTAVYQQGFPLLAIPGFPFESILLGLVMGAISLGLLRRRKLTSR
jgi:M6 family metalloprotease-like protein